LNIEELIERYYKLVYKICKDLLFNPQEAEDMCQETYISIYLNLDKYKNLNENDYKNIICKIALNKCRDLLRKKNSKKELVLEDNIIKFDSLEISEKFEDDIIKKDGAKQIVNLIESLKVPYNKLLYEYYINEKTLDQIAIENKTSKGTIKVQIYRGKEILRKEIKKVGGEFYEMY
jgi:RNA polymerase sigma-70 factor (ECF subfamily)